jgi:hypothetical protein
MAIAGVPLLDQIPLDQILHMIHKKDGIITQIAEALGIECKTIYNLMESHPEVRVAVDEARKNHLRDLQDLDKEFVKLAYDSLKYHLKDRDITATIFTLKTKGGYKEQIVNDTTIKQILVTHPYEAVSNASSDGEASA